MKLFQNPDGASPQARAVLAYLSRHENISGSWSKDLFRYIAEPTVARWHNGHEQGYVVSMRSGSGDRQINVAFFENRSSNIFAMLWEELTVSGNPPELSSKEHRHEIAHYEGFGKARDMADWIYGRLAAFWAETDERAL